MRLQLATTCEAGPGLSRPPCAVPRPPLCAESNNNGLSPEARRRRPTWTLIRLAGRRGRDVFGLNQRPAAHLPTDKRRRKRGRRRGRLPWWTLQQHQQWLRRRQDGRQTYSPYGERSKSHRRCISGNVRRTSNPVNTSQAGTTAALLLTDDHHYRPRVEILIKFHCRVAMCSVYTVHWNLISYVYPHEMPAQYKVHNGKKNKK